MKKKKAEPLRDVEMPDAGELPEGWRYATILDVCEVNPPKPSKDFLAADAPVTFVPMPAVDAELGAITNPEKQPFLKVRNGFSSFRDGDVIMAKITPCMENGKAAIVHDMTNGIGFGSTEFHVMRSRGEILPEYLYYYIRQVSFRKEAESHFTGSVGQKRVPADFIKQSIIPLPPLTEQQRIISRIEALLAHVSAARERLNRVPLVMKRFRQGVLAAVCSGRLTEGWREGQTNLETASDLYNRVNFGRLQKYHDAIEEAKKKKKRPPQKPIFFVEPECDADSLTEIPEEWVWKKVLHLGNYGEDVVKTGPFGAILKSKEFVTSGVPIIAIGNVQWGHLDLKNARVDHVTDKKASELEVYRVWEGDVLFTRSGTIGRSLVVPDCANGWLMSYHLLRVRANSNLVDPHYLYFVFAGCEPSKDYTSDATIGSTRPGINTTILENLPVPLPPLAEQHEIIRRVNALFARADAVEREVAAATKWAEALTQAVLARAFRGELR
jgi:type I restriction enzyme S subunit